MHGEERSPGYAGRMKARAPASAANLGPGFDTLAVALSLYVEVEVDKSDALRIEATGEGADLPRDESHLAAKLAREILGHDRVAIRIHSDIPVARGLGSSSALVVAAAAAMGADDPLEVAARFDGHVDNAAAAFSGGLVAGTLVDEKPYATSLFLDPDITFVLVVPDFKLETKISREVLPTTIGREDAVFNLGRMAWLISALADVDNFAPEIMDDRLHQPYRTSLFPASTEILAAMRRAGALSSCWSGAGPSLLGVVNGEILAEQVCDAAQIALDNAGLTGTATVLAPDMCGLSVE